MKTLIKTADDPVLLRLRRQYGKDESLKYLFDLIKQQAFQLGELRSQKSELEHDLMAEEENVEDLKREIAELNEKLKTKEPNAIIEQLKKQSASQSKTNKRLENDLILWRNKYCDLLAAQHKPRPL